MEICNRDLCTGCGVCSVVCPKKCISMNESTIGHLYPKINTNLCIECHMCEKMCPTNRRLDKNRAQKAYACWSLDDNERNNSTSGGIATVLCDSFIQNGNIVYGSALHHNKIQHIRVENECDIKLLQGSKYVESPIINVLPQIKTDITDGKKVLFIGTPCQCAAVSAIMGNGNENLFVIEIICTGVPPQKLLWEHLKEYNKIDKIKFRDNIGTQLSVWSDNKLIYQKPVWEDSFLMGFSKHLYFRDSCYKCKYASMDRGANLTIGDFWGLGKVQPFTKDISAGVSVVLVNDEKGMHLFDSIKKRIFFEERLLEEAINGNPRYYSPSWKHKNYSRFIQLYEEYGFEKALKKSLVKESFKYYLYSKKYKLKELVKGKR